MQCMPSYNTVVRDNNSLLTLKKWSSRENLFSALTTLLVALLSTTDGGGGKLLVVGVAAAVPTRSACSVAACAAACAMLTAGLSGASITDTDKLLALSLGLKTYTDWPATLQQKQRQEDDNPLCACVFVVSLCTQGSSNAHT